MKPVFHIFGTSVSAYLVLALLGLAAGLLLGELTRRRIGLSRGGLLRFTLFCLLAAILGAKLLYLLIEWERTLSDPWGMISGGGFVFYGGLFAFFPAATLWCRRTQTPLLPMLDIFLPGVTLFHAFGRVGCFLAGCCYGCETTAAWGVIYPAGGIAPSGIPLLPVQLYEAAFLLLLTAALLFLLKREKTYGTVCGSYLCAYAIWRFCIEFFRSDPRGALLGLSTSQIFSIPLLLCGIFLLRGRK